MMKAELRLFEDWLSLRTIRTAEGHRFTFPQGRLYMLGLLERDRERASMVIDLEALPSDYQIGQVAEPPADPKGSTPPKTRSKTNAKGA